MTAPTLIATSGNTWTTITGGSRTTGSLTWQTGDFLVVIGITEDNSIGLGVPTGTGLTFTQQLATNTANTCKIYVWTATAGSGNTGTISSSSTANVMTNIQAFVYRGTTGLGATASIASGTADTISLARASDNSAVIWAAGDFAATNDTTVAATPAGGTQRQAAISSGRATMFLFDWGDQGSAGTTSYGITGFTTTGVFTKAAVEIKGTVSTTNSNFLAFM